MRGEEGGKPREKEGEKRKEEVWRMGRREDL
jgi:hypothetical protein